MAQTNDDSHELHAVFTNEVIRAIGSLARQQNVCREQGGQVVFVSGIDAAREYIIETLLAARAAKSPAETMREHLDGFGK